MLEKAFSPGAVPDETITVITVKWQPFEDFYTTAQFVTTPLVAGNTPYASEIHVAASRLWLARHPASGGITFDDQVPGYRDEWMFTPSS